MSTSIGIVIGAVAGIVFTFAFPEPAMAVNNVVSPYISGATDFAIEQIKNIIVSMVVGN